MTQKGLILTETRLSHLFAAYWFSKIKWYWLSPSKPHPRASIRLSPSLFPVKKKRPVYELKNWHWIAWLPTNLLSVLRWRPDVFTPWAHGCQQLFRFFLSPFPFPVLFQTVASIWTSSHHAIQQPIRHYTIATPHATTPWSFMQLWYIWHRTIEKQTDLKEGSV